MKFNVTCSSEGRMRRIEVEGEPIDLPNSPAGAFAVHRDVFGDRDGFVVSHVETGFRVGRADTAERVIEAARIATASRTPEEIAQWVSRAKAQIERSTDPDRIDDVQTLRRELRAAQGMIADQAETIKRITADRNSIDGVLKSMAGEFSRIIVAHKLEDGSAVKSLLDDFCARHVIVNDERTTAGAIH